MDKEEINLLPPHARAARLRRLVMRRMKSLMRPVIFSLVLLSAALALVFAIEMRRRQELPAIGNETPEISATEQEITAFNQLAAFVAAHQRERPPWGPVIRQIVEVIPVHMALVELQLENDGQTLTLVGRGGSRDDVIALQKDLEALPAIGDVNAPLENFATGDGRFSLTVTRADN